MSVLIAVEMYPVAEVCEILARRKNRHTYDRRQVGALIKAKLPTAQMIGGRYMLTEREIDWLASEIRAYRRRGSKVDR